MGKKSTLSCRSLNYSAFFVDILRHPLKYLSKIWDVDRRGSRSTGANGASCTDWFLRCCWLHLSSNFAPNRLQIQSARSGQSSVTWERVWIFICIIVYLFFLVNKCLWRLQAIWGFVGLGVRESGIFVSARKKRSNIPGSEEKGALAQSRGPMVRLEKVLGCLGWPRFWMQVWV